MIDYISSNTNDVLTNAAVNNKANLKLVDNNSSNNSSSSSSTDDIYDESNISSQAAKMYQQEQDFNKYKNMVMTGLNNNVAPSQLVSMIQNGQYLSNDELAGSLLDNSSFVSMLYGH